MGLCLNQKPFLSCFYFGISVQVFCHTEELFSEIVPNVWSIYKILKLNHPKINVNTGF